MNKTKEEKILIRVSPPKPVSNIVNVTRVLPDGSEEFIGQISPDFTDGEDSIKYVSVNNLGEELLPPTSDFIDIENHFVKYAQEMKEKSLTTDLDERMQEFEERGKVLKGLRQLKFGLQSKFISR